MILKNYLKRVMPSLSSIVFVLAWFAIAPLVRAVVPAPDGGYPGFNTAEGQNALFNVTTGVGNTGVGWFSLWSDTDGSYNTALGAGTLLFNVGDQSTGEGAHHFYQYGHRIFKKKNLCGASWRFQWTRIKSIRSFQDTIHWRMLTCKNNSIVIRWLSNHFQFICY